MAGAREGSLHERAAQAPQHATQLQLRHRFRETPDETGSARVFAVNGHERFCNREQGYLPYITLQM
jgi:hypothetical protein